MSKLEIRKMCVFFNEKSMQYYVFLMKIYGSNKSKLKITIFLIKFCKCTYYYLTYFVVVSGQPRMNLLDR